MNLKALAAVTALATGASAQVFKNLDFSAACPACPSGLEAWTVSWASKGVRCEPAVDGVNTALRISGTNRDGVGFVEQGAAPPNAADCIVTFSALVRCEGVVGRGAGLNLGGCDAAGASVFNQDMGYASLRWLLGTREWERCTIRAVCPAGTATVKVGAILYGSGQVWFDDCQVAFAPIEGRTAGPAATAYVQTAWDLMERNALNHERLEPGVKEIALRIAGDADDPADYHLAVQYLLARLEDHHSFLMRPDEVRKWKDEPSGPEDEASRPRHRLVEGCGYVSVPFFHGSDEKSMREFARAVHTALRELDAAGATGWIIDLRGNTGGNMEPMIAGLGPLLDQGSLGFLVDVRGGRETWSYEPGVYKSQGEAGLTVPDPFVPARRLPVAVLIGPRTGSSGEAVAISFIGNAATRTFGQPTWGLTTGNGNFDLPDGARMFMASTTMADRTGRVYPGPLEPDERVEPGGEGDAVLARAAAWIKATVDGGR